MSEKLFEVTGYDVPKVALGNQPFDILQEAVDTINEHGFTINSADMLIKASKASQAQKKANALLAKYRDAKAAFLREKAGVSADDLPIQQTEDLRE